MAELKNLSTKLVKVMNAVGHIKKDGRNDFHHYNYVTEAAVMAEVRKALINEGVFLSQSVENLGKEGDLTTVVMYNTFIDTISGETLTVKSVGQGQDKGDKGSAKAITNAVKYMLLKNFMLSTGDDDPEATDENGKSTGAIQKDTSKYKPTAVVTPAEPVLEKKRVSFSKKAFKPTTTETAATSGDSEL